MNVCKFCRCSLHHREDGTGWVENDEPNCPSNPSGPTYGHMADAGEKIQR